MDMLPDAAAILPECVRQFNLLRGFLWYISLAFTISLLLRLRFYYAVLRVARYVSDSCPNIYQLMQRHWILCITNGLVPLVGLYLGILIVYVGLNQFVWPLASINLIELAETGPERLVLHVVAISLMITVDAVLIAQVGVIDSERVQSDLSYAEGWLGGNLNQILQRLGKWNPIKRYADSKARENLLWFNDIFRANLRLIIAETVLRIGVALLLFLEAVRRI